MTDTSGLDALGELSSRRTQMIIIAGQRRLKNGHFKQNLENLARSGIFGYRAPSSTKHYALSKSQMSLQRAALLARLCRVCAFGLEFSIGPFCRIGPV
jgi:hypothetical protein